MYVHIQLITVKAFLFVGFQGEIIHTFGILLLKAVCDKQTVLQACAFEGLYTQCVCVCACLGLSHRWNLMSGLGWACWETCALEWGNVKLVVCGKCNITDCQCCFGRWLPEVAGHPMSRAWLIRNSSLKRSRGRDQYRANSFQPGCNSFSFVTTGPLRTYHVWATRSQIGSNCGSFEVTCSAIMPASCLADLIHNLVNVQAPGVPWFALKHVGWFAIHEDKKLKNFTSRSVSRWEC